MSEVVSIRLPKGTVGKLKLLSYKLSLEQQKEVRWTSLLKEAIDKLLAERGKEGTEG